jgi:purine-nucleoside phosphorylase
VRYDIPSFWHTSLGLSIIVKLTYKVYKLHGLSETVGDGNVFTSDALFTHSKEFLDKLSSRNHIAVELEGAGLYFLANLLGFKAVSVHLIYRNANGESMSAEDINKTEKVIAEALLESL